MSPMPDPDDWRRLGLLLQRRRGELGPQVANLAKFTADRGLNYRMAWDLEAGARDNYRTATLRAGEVAYGWGAGSIDRVLEGGEPAAERPPARSANPLDALPPAKRAVAEEFIRLLQGLGDEAPGERNSA